MKSVYDIIQELNNENGSNYKMDVLRKYEDHDLLKRVLKLTYDKTTYTYGITLKNVNHPGFEIESDNKRSLVEALNRIENDFVTRNVTGNNALDVLSDLLYSLSIEDRHILHGIIRRDLRINMGRSNINKVFKNLIVKPVYMRCGLYNEKTAKKINFPAYIQLKADGTYREFTINDDEVSCISRSGQEYDYPDIFNELMSFPDGKYFGELTVFRDGKLLDRATGNGIIISDDIPDNCEIILDLWDFVESIEYQNARNKIKGTTPYFERYKKLKDILYDCSPIVNIIETHEVESVSEALQYCSKWMGDGLEGGILKDKNSIFRDGTSPQQLKIKVEMDIDVRITGFLEGREGTKREETFGSMLFESDDKMIKGRTSGFTDDQLEDFNSRRDELIGQIMSVQCNDITKARDSEFFALSHPRFIELRDDKKETDTIERALEIKEMALIL